VTTAETSARDPGAYCREVEAYLCRKNHGHLVRIVGPAFELVSGWATAGVPIQAVTRGIDRKLERYVSAGRSRRPLHIEHCKADVLEAFDAWRRAVGVTGTGVGGPADRDDGVAARTAAKPRALSLPAHIDRALTKATTLLALAEAAPGLHAALEQLVAELDVLRRDARGARGAARAAYLGRLVAIDQQLLERVRIAAGPTLDDIGATADRELAPFKPRMADAVYAKAWSAAAERALRERFRLPTVRVD
jgi:hypothetical protein